MISSIFELRLVEIQLSYSLLTSMMISVTFSGMLRNGTWPVGILTTFSKAPIVLNDCWYSGLTVSSFSQNMYVFGILMSDSMKSGFRSKLLRLWVLKTCDQASSRASGDRSLKNKGLASSDRFKMPD